MKHSKFINFGVDGHENISSTKTLLTDKKICSKHLFGTQFEKYLRKNEYVGGPNKSGGWKIFKN